MIIKTGARKPVVKVETPAVMPPPVTDPFDSPSYKDMPAYKPPVKSSTLELFKDLDQGTPEWLDARAGIVTASVVHLLLSSKTLKIADNETSRGLTATLAAERITGYVEPMATSRDMERGTLDEPYARDVYSERYAPVTELGFMVRDFGGFKLGYSPDGLVGDDGLIEIKSRKQKIQLRTFLSDAVPDENMAQIQTGLLVSGRDWLDYMSYTGGMSPYVKRVHPDAAYQAAIMTAVEQVETNVTNMVDAYLKATDGNPPTERIDHFAELEFTF